MTVILDRPAETAAGADLLQHLALDITRACQAACTHCYNGSSPQGTHGAMTRADWLSLLDQAAAVGVRQVQFIGGEPTLHPDIADLINRAVDHGMAVEVFSNLIHIRAVLWPVLRQRGVTLATSYYSDTAEEHEQITKHRASYAKTKANIERALAYRIPLRAGTVHVRPGQRVTEAMAELRALGVQHIRTDRLREIGRGAGTQDAHQITELCGHCANGRAAVLPDGSVAGCVMSGGMMTAGNVLTTPLAEIVSSPAWATLAAAIPRPRRTAAHRGDECHPVGECTPGDDCSPMHECTPNHDGCGPHMVGEACVPDSCTPREDSCQPSPGIGAIRQLAYTATACNPDQDGSDCAPAESEACAPAYDD
ncbi:radical SAM/SPASM domain-containing protein [Streptomyces sp. CA2R106]|uniref:radical SAM/SPASM domain-containing protein n=1 Tax=Streptomyces sp. CA2R106 TaxID=3120153 RepID=UPI00300A1B68